MKASLVILLLMCMAMTGCDTGQNKSLPGQVRTTTMQIGNRSFDLEIADSYGSRQKGLMYRKSLPHNGGMIFVFDSDEVLRFWMKNTYIPLDVLYLDKQGTIVAIRQMKPLDETSISSDKPARYAIELNEGTANQVGVKTGDRLTIPPLN